MQAEQAKAVLAAAVRCMSATDRLFDAVNEHGEQESAMSDDELVAIVTEYCDAKQSFDNAIITRGVLGVKDRESA